MIVTLASTDLCVSMVLGKPNQMQLVSEKYIKSLIDYKCFYLWYDLLFESMYKTLGKMWMLSVSCRLVSIYCYAFSCVLSLLIHNCCRRCLVYFAPSSDT